MTDERIGRRTESGVEYPTKTLSGAPYSRADQLAPPSVVQLTNTEFVVLDAFPPLGFDRNAAIEALRRPVRSVRRAETEPERFGE